MSLNHGATLKIEELANEQQAKRLLRLRFPQNDGPGAVMLANTLDAHEGLSTDFRLSVEVLSDNATIRHDDLLGKMVTIELVREDGTLRYFNGYVFEFRLVKTDGGFAFYTMALEPWMSYLRLRHDNVAFHHLSVRDLTDKVCEPYLKRDWRHRIAGDDPPITYSCQHNESEHNFLHRHWEGRGWYYHYEHRADAHTLVLSDNSTRTAGPIEGARTDMPFQHQAGAVEDDGLHQWSPTRRIGSDKMTVASFNFKHPRPKLAERTSAQSRSAEPQLEVYENMGTYAFKDYPEGEAVAQLRLEEADARRSEFVATGNDRTAEPGRWFTLSGHFATGGDGSAADQKYLITSVHHRATNNYQDGRHAVSHYRNEIVCIAHSVPWRPGRNFNSTTPRIFGVQTAIVVGPPGEEIYTDEYGRVKVQFHWDRKGEHDDKSSPWVRVVSSWAGAQFGQISLPRVGMEVVVQFLDGNIDHPLITGCVYNANNMPPWALPDNKTQSGILTRSSREGRAAHANALRFEDKHGQEELWLHAEKDQRIEVEHDESHWVGNDRKKMVRRDETVEVKHDRTETVGHDERITVLNNRTEKVEQDESIFIGSNRTETVGKNDQVTIRGRRSERVVLAKEESVGLGKALTIGGVYQVSVGAAMNTTVGMSQSTQIAASKRALVGASYVIDVGDQLSINVGAASFRMSSDGAISLGGSSISIEASGQVTINGKSVDLNIGAGRRGEAAKTTMASGSPTEPVTTPDEPSDVLAAGARDASSGDAQSTQTENALMLRVPPASKGALPTPDNRAILNAADYQMRSAASGIGGKIERPMIAESPFDEAQQAQINAALDDSRQQLLQKSISLKRWNQNDKDDFFKAFGTDSDEARNLIMSRTSQMVEINEKMSVANFVPIEKKAGADEEDMVAYVLPFISDHEIHLAPRFWDIELEGGEDTQASVLVHEMSHFPLADGCIPGASEKTCYALDGYLDPATGQDAVDPANGKRIAVYGAEENAKLTPFQALYHADSYKGYVSGSMVARERPLGLAGANP